MTSSMPRLLATITAFAFFAAQGEAGGLKPSVIIFKDGFVITGKVKLPRDYIVDPGGASFSTAKPGSTFYIDDVARQILFSPSQVQEILDEDRDKDLIALKIARPGVAGRGLPGWKTVSEGEWNDKWERDLIVTISGREETVRQRITLLTPKLVQIDTLRYDWVPYLYTQELGPDLVRSLLYKYYAGKKDVKESDKRLQIFRFLYQCGWYGHATKELDDYVKDFPAFKSDIEKYRDNLKNVKAKLFLENLLLASKKGQHEHVREALEQYGKFAKLLGVEDALKVQDIKNKFQAADEKLKKARSFLTTLLKGVTANKALFVEAANIILEELNLDSLPRLDTFLEYASQYEREIKQKRKPTQSPEQVLSLALSGWLQGNELAEPEAKTAVLLWKARQMVLEYLKNDEVNGRRQLLDSFLKASPIAVDVLDRLIRHLPPIDAYDDEIDTDPIKLEIGGDGPANGTTYHVQLPPDYNHARSYPVVFLLRASGDKAENMLARFRKLGAKHGYILVAPNHGDALDYNYKWSTKEHAAVLDCLRELRRRFQVDSDKVFLLGFRQGGTMAWDIGISHPDQFAGVLTMSGTPQPYPQHCWSNGQYLPFYAVEGDINGNNPKYHRKVFKDWVRGQYPSLYIEYKGRGSEWFGAELPKMFDWMNRKTRAYPIRQLGVAHTGGRPSEEFKTMRESDNHFYWLSTDSIAPNHLASAAMLAKNARVIPATMQASIATANELNLKKDGVAAKAQIWNHINVRTSGVHNVTIWLGPKMIDFTKPVRIRVNSGVAGRDRVIPPSPHVLLEEFYMQGDRQRLFYARINVPLK
jgi:pimeloyl-ACP methyl ester carboxylesterase